MEMKKGLPAFDFDSMDKVAEQTPEPKVYNCPKHGLFRSVIELDPSSIQKYCPECEKEFNARKEAEYERSLHIKHCKECNVEEEYWFKTLDDYKPETAMEKVALDAVEAMMNTRHGKIFIVGCNGVGKTLLGSILARDLNGRIYSMYEISTMIRQSYTTRAERTELEIVNELASIPFLAIDELGRTKGSEAELNWLSYVLDKRHTRKLPFMIMTNGHFNADCPHNGCSQCIENFIGNDILSRLQEDSVIVNLKDSRDRRRG